MEELANLERALAYPFLNGDDFVMMEVRGDFLDLSKVGYHVFFPCFVVE